MSGYPTILPSALVDALIRGDEETENFSHPNVINEEGRTPLHIACKCGNLEMVQLLIRHGARAIEDVQHKTPLALALLHRHQKIALALLKKFGCNPNDGVSLLIACKHGDLSMVQTLIEHGANVTNKDHYGNTPLSLAVLHSHDSIVSALVSEFGCDPNDDLFLHTACKHGDLYMVKTLIEHGADLTIKDVNGNTPLSMAVLHGHDSIVSALVSEFGCDPNDGVSLYTACKLGNLHVIVTLVKFGARDVKNMTPLSLAVLHHHDSIVPALVSEFGCDPNDGVSLHTACEHGDLSMVKTLIEHGAYVNDVGFKDNTPLSLAVLHNHTSIVSALVSEFGCDPNDGVSLHTACEHGNMSMVKTLIELGANVNNANIEGKTPLSLAVLHNHDVIVKALVSEFCCDPNDGVSLHIACEYGNLNMVKTLILLSASVNGKNSDGKTPIYYAVEKKWSRTILALLKNCKCDLNTKDNLGMTVLHVACRHGDLKTYKILIEHGACVNDHVTLLMTAVKFNKCEIVKSLVSEYGGDVNMQGSERKSLLHEVNSKEMLDLLINEYGMSPLLVDEEGNTPLHICSMIGHSNCVRSLLYDFQSPVYIRNSSGRTPRDVATDFASRVFDDYISQHQDEIEEYYKSIQKVAATRYSGSHCITRVFVVGHPGAGKSSLVEALKREGFIESFNRVSSKSVALHTAGIVPSIHTSDSYGRVQFYDFAGDPEYYSSHAAILEKLFLTDIGNNICIIVLNLQDEDIELERKYDYWLTFIEHNTKNLKHPPSVVVTGSHADLLSKKGLQKKEDCVKSLLNKIGTKQVYLPLDCCGPRSTNIKLLRQEFYKNNFEPYNLSYKGSVLLGLLEKDFSNVTACTAKTIATHIAAVNLLRLPRSGSGLHLILKELQAIGSLLILGGKEEDCYLVLNVSQLTNEVHKKLFSREAFSNKPDIASFNIGLLPQSLLQEVLPPYITKECLTQLQYCQEISHVEIGQDYSISPSTESAQVSSPDKSLLFFPALCKLDRSNVSWLIPPEGSYSIGWLARCTNSHDFFPPRFLHVLLLRISLRFTLVAPTNLHPSQDTPPDHVPLKRRCKMWKTGVHWLTEEGVECEVDVDISKEVVVSIRSEEHSKNVLTVFNSIISCVMEAKAEFCHSIQLECFLLDKVGCLSEDNLFQIEEVERVLGEGKKKVVSARGDTWMCSSKLFHIRSSFWDSLFSLDEKTVLKYLNEIVRKWFQLGIYLDLPKSTLDAIEYNHPKDVERCKIEMVATWLSTYHPHPPSWWTLVKALQQVEESASAECIKRDLDKEIRIQRKLLEADYSCVKPEEEFLRLFSGAVGSKWPYLAALLLLGSSEIKEVREGLSQNNHAFLMLSKWASREGATYGQLYEKLKPTTILQLCK